MSSLKPFNVSERPPFPQTVGLLSDTTGVNMSPTYCSGDFGDTL